MAKENEIQVELLLGRRVFAISGKSVGHLEEIRAEIREGEWFVQEFLVGSYALFERLAAWEIGRAVLRLFGAKRKHGGYRVPWDKIDLSDAERPRLVCSVKELETLED